MIAISLIFIYMLVSAHTEYFRCHPKAAVHNVKYRDTHTGQPMKGKRLRMQRGDYVSSDCRYSVILHEHDSVG